MGGAFASIDELKARLVRSHAARRARIERGDLTVVGVNDFTESEPSPLGGGGEHPRGRSGSRGRRSSPRSASGVRPATRAQSRPRSTALAAAAAAGDNIMEPSIALAHAGGTTGEWAEILRQRVRRVPGADRRGRAPDRGRRRRRSPRSPNGCATSRAVRRGC